MLRLGTPDLAPAGAREHAGRRPLPDADLLVGATLLLYGAVYLAWQGSHWGGPSLELAINDAAFLPLGLAAVALALRASLRAPSRRSRWAWRVIAAGFASYLAGDLLYFDIEVLQAREVPFPSVADIGYLAFYPLLLAGLLLLPRARAEHRLKATLDLAIVVLAATTAVWYLVLAPVAAAAGSNPLAAAVAMAYPVGDTLLLFALGAALLSRLTETPPATVVFLGAGVCLNIVADLVYARLSLDATYQSGTWLDASYMLGWVAMGLAGVAHVRGIHRAQASGRRLPETRPISLLPYAAVAVVYGLLALATARAPGDVRALVAGAIGVTALVVARQVVTARENARLLSERATARSEARLGAIIRNASDVIALVDNEGRIGYVTPSVQALCGWMPTDLVGTPVSRLVRPADAPLLQELLQTAAQRPTGAGPIACDALSERRVHLEVQAANLLAEPLVQGLVLTMRDVTERRSFEEQLRTQALRDPLTGLANRALLTDRIEHALRRARRRTTRPALLYLDLDAFKAINDTAGHLAGDQVLAEVAARLRQTVRTEDTAARLGGDEFAILMEDTRTVDDAVVLAGRVQDALGRPFAVAGAEMALTVSVGIARPEVTPATALDLVRDADIALYEAKRAGRGTYQVFAPAMYAATVERAQLEADLRLALERDEFALVYQPLFDLASDALVGVEALLRWNHPSRGLVMPNEFIALAESSGEIRRMGRWVLAEACGTVGAWNAQLDGHALRANVNVSVRQLVPGFVAEVAGVLAETGFPPGLLVLEVTESAFAADRDVLVGVLGELRGLGVRTAIDDFGTGYSTLGYLRDLPVDELKIDASFVRQLGEGRDNGLVATIVQLGREFNLATVAEGIELAAQLEQLRALGCQVGQGFLLSRPAMPAAIEARLGLGAAPETEAVSA